MNLSNDRRRSSDPPADEGSPARPAPPDSAAADEEPASGDLTGQRLGEMQFLRRLGRGGMADVYVATQLTLGRQIAVKVLRQDLARDASYVERFRREARAVAKLTHPNIVQVYEVGQANGFHYIAQEYVDGLNLRQQLDRHGPLSVELAVAVLRGVASALQAADEAGITHRDIKPENVMLAARGGVKVADFGLARVASGEAKNDLTQVGLTMGTPLYMSPEQVQGQAVDVRSDLYSLGVTVYHLLSGRPPFEAESPLAIAIQHLHQVPPPLTETRPTEDLPPWLSETVNRLIAKRPEERFQSPAELLEQLNQADALGDAPLSGEAAVRSDAMRNLRQTMAMETAVRRRRWRTRFLIAATAILLPLVSAAAGAMLASQRQLPEMQTLLGGDPMRVAEFASVDQQYFEALLLDRPRAWRAVWERFPPEEGPLNAAYAARARLQLARLHRESSQLELAREQIDWLRANTDSTLYRALALVELERIQLEAGEGDAAGESRELLREEYRRLRQQYPEDRQTFDRVAPSQVVQRLQGLVEAAEPETS